MKYFFVTIFLACAMTFSSGSHASSLGVRVFRKLVPPAAWREGANSLPETAALEPPDRPTISQIMGSAKVKKMIRYMRMINMVRDKDGSYGFSLSYERDL